MKRTKFIGFLMSIMIVSACTSEWNLANSYVEKFSTKSYVPTEAIYVCLPTSVVHTNQTLNQMDDFLDLSEEQQDSVINTNTKFLNKLDDAVFLKQFNDNLVYHLKRLGIPVTVVSNAQELPKAVPNKIFTLNIVQVEAEEFVKKTRSDFYDAEVYYHYDYDLNGFSTNVWYLLNDTIANDTNPTVYYKNFEVTDVFNGEVRSIKGQKAHVTGKMQRIAINDAYKTAYLAGVISAKLFLEKIITEYVGSQVKGMPNYYFKYNPMTNRLYDYEYLERGKEESFQKIEE